MENNNPKPIVLLIFLFGLSQLSLADITSSQIKHITYQVPLNKSLLINLDNSIGKIVKGEDNIADILLFPPKQILLRGKSLGITNAIIWDNHKRVDLVLNVEVVHNLESLKQKIYELLPNEQIQVHTAQKNIVLSGEVSNIVKMDVAMKLAQGYVIQSNDTGSDGQKNTGVINMMHVGGGQQVMLEVTIAEVSRSIGRTLEINTSAANTTDNPSGDESGNSLVDGDMVWRALSKGAGLFTGSYVLGETIFEWTLDFSKDTDLVTILAEPNLTTLSGKKASFLSGGEFPYATNCELGNCDVEFKKFGIGIEFTPVVLDANRINLNTFVSVSTLTNKANLVTGGAGNTPSLDLREAQTSIELADGQTMSIAGLLSDEKENSQSQTPGLADLPLIGTFFRNRTAKREQKELIILVTPHLARPIPQDQIRLPTDSYVHPDDFDFYVLGRMEARKTKPEIPEDGGINGQFGHQINDKSL